MLEQTKKMYADIGVDVEKALNTLSNIPISIHCWQGDDVMGFDSDGGLTGGIQTIGNYPGKARNPQELMAEPARLLRHLCPWRKSGSGQTGA